jgi:four helix bundle protein
MTAVRRFQDLICWQLSYALRSEIFDATQEGPVARDFRFRDQIRDSSASAPRNIAEGFARFAPKEFARFLSYAHASIVETKNHLIDGHDRKYFSGPQSQRLLSLATAAETATKHLMLSKMRQASEDSPPNRK